MDTLKAGMKGTAQEVVTDKNTAMAVSSGTALVYATPAMVALMEAAAIDAVRSALPEGSATVGTALNITHDAATPVGMQVRAEAVLQAADGRRLSFTIEAFDEKGHIGGGTHERFIIDSARFQAKADKKLEN